jgi:hypothetical protein
MATSGERNPGRDLVAKRRTVEVTCALDGCDVIVRSRIRDADTGELERRYCSDRHRSRAYYLEHKEERLEYQRNRRRRPAPGGEGGAS